MTIKKKGQLIRTLEEWATQAGPKSGTQWKDHRSAKEVARCWLGVTSPTLPPEVEALLAPHPAFGPVVDWHAEPEVRLSFDGYRGEPRNTDLLVHARDTHGDYLVAIEAKADESFGASVSNTIAAAVERKARNPRSNGEARARELVERLWGVHAGDPLIGGLRYQLLTATAGALEAGRKLKVGRVILLIQEFKTMLTTDRKHAANTRDLDRFVLRLSGGSIPSVEPGKLFGPLVVPGAKLFEAPAPDFYVGKVVRDIR